MRCVAPTALAALSLLACRPYDGYAPIAAQDGLVPAATFARYGQEQAEAIAIGRSLAEWKGTSDPDGSAQQTGHAACFARRFPNVRTVDADPLGHRLTIQFASGWRAAVLPVHDGVRPESTPGIPALDNSTCP